MSSITAAIFATKVTSTQEHQLTAYALLFEGSVPVWEIHIGGKVFRFIANTDYILEDGLWQLIDYCNIPRAEYVHDVSNNIPNPIEEEMGEDICKEQRENITVKLYENNLHFKITTWPGVWMPKLNQKIEEWNSYGIQITCDA
ncbi:MAG: hypothetical protein RIR96_601 [Bacteroidota bacterium]|jgi:hypothetical protein